MWGTEASSVWKAISRMKNVFQRLSRISSASIEEVLSFFSRSIDDRFIALKKSPKIDFVTNINCPHLKIINISDVTVVEFTGQCYLPRLSDHGVTIRQRYWANSANCMYRMIVRNWWFVKQKFMVILSFCQEKSFRLHVLNSRPFDNFLAFNIYMQ